MDGKKEKLNRGFTMIPSKYAAQNFKNIIHGSQPIFTGLLNSFIVAACTAFLCTYFSTVTAFAIYAYDFKLKKVIFTFILAIMMIPTQVTALGFVQLVDKMGLMDSFIPLIVPAIASPVVFFYMKQSMDAGLPKEPLMKPSIAVQAIFSFVSSWNNYFTPALILKKDNKKTLPILIALLRGADFLKFDMGQVYMFIACSILPVIIVYLCLAKNIVAGMTSGAVKG